MRVDIDAKTLPELFDFNLKAGALYWRSRGPEWFQSKKYPAERLAESWNTRHAGREALTAVHTSGYRMGRILGQDYFAHRVLWALHSGVWPGQFIDHIDGDPANNRIDNLREATRAENARNRGGKKNGSSQHIGVCRHKTSRKWHATIHVDKKQIHLGSFDEEAEAASVYAAAAKRHFGEFASYTLDPKP